MVYGAAFDKEGRMDYESTVVENLIKGLQTLVSSVKSDEKTGWDDANLVSAAEKIVQIDFPNLLRIPQEFTDPIKLVWSSEQVQLKFRDRGNLFGSRVQDSLRY
jgi:hypothetical protein